ncbi:MAG: hypothetical protein AAGI34_16680 [Pseudomonadota bacterium]
MPHTALHPTPTLQPPPGTDMSRLEHLRRCAQRCRLCPRQSCDALCLALRQTAAEADGDAFACALLRVLPEALGKRLVLHRPGSAELSFDEAWLLRLIDAAEREDADTLSFALTSRVHPALRRSVRFLVGGLVAPVDAPPRQAAC